MNATHPLFSLKNVFIERIFFISGRVKYTVALAKITTFRSNFVGSVQVKTLSGAKTIISDL